MLHFHTGVYQCLELFIKGPSEGPESMIRLKGPMEGENCGERRERAGNGYYRWVRFPVEKNRDYGLDLGGCEAGLLYLSDCEDLLDRGICYLELTPDGSRLEPAGRKMTSYRERYHFTPYKNWINDPNGLCFFKGYYHMYYQYNPFSQQWGNPYWGHAASRDLIHWKDLPVCLEPQQEILEDKGKMGGAFSGSAVPVGKEKIIFYLTRHSEDLGDEERVKEVQVMTESRDGIRFGSELTVVEGDRGQSARHFRDPKAEVWKDGKWHMVIGTCCGRLPSVAYYRSENGVDWNYEGALLEEKKARGIETIECPDLFPLEDKMVLTASLMRYDSEPVDRQHVRYYLGTWKDGIFRTERSGLLDFGGSLYAVQSFLAGDQRIMIGWVADFWNEHIEEDGGCNGSMTIPRVTEIKNSCLVTRPAEAVYRLKKELIYRGAKGPFHLEAIEGNAWYAKLEFDGATEFRLRLMKDGEEGLYLGYRDGILSFVSERQDKKRADGAVSISGIRQLEIFVDRRLAEVFVNGGEAAGTRIFYGEQGCGSFLGEFSDPGSVRGAEVYTMHSIWEGGEG